MQTSMIQAWRAAFDNARAFFGFVQLSTFCAPYAIEHLPQLREQQLASLVLPNVGYATNADHGAGCYSELCPLLPSECGAIARFSWSYF